MNQAAASLYGGINREPAPFYADIANGPEGGAAWWVTAEDGVRLRFVSWLAGSSNGAKGTVLIFPGRTEYLEKYGITASDLAEHGYASVAIDWRGQGLADRALPNPKVGHIDDFKEYQKDLRAVLKGLDDLDLPRPYFLLCHSMGGAIGLRSLMEGLDVASVAFSAPMWGISLSPIRRPAGWAVSHISRRIGFQGALAPGTFETPYVLLNPFDDNMLTTDPEMFAMLRHQLEKHPDLSLGGPSMAWLNEALIECRGLSQRPTPDFAALTLLGGNERIVDIPAIHDRMERWSKGELKIIEGAEHEILMDSPARRKAAIADITAHFERSLG